MRYLKTALFIVIGCLAFTVSTQATNGFNIKKDNSRAYVQYEKGQKKLVLKTGRKTLSTDYSAYSNDIVLAINANTWAILDSLVNAPWGSALKMEDIYGYKVDVAKANINSSVGLMFTSGSKCVALKKEELDALKR